MKSLSMSSEGRLARFAVVLIGAVVCGGSFAACSEDRERLDTGKRVFTEPDAEPPPAPAACGFQCSRDLKKVIQRCDGVETEVKTCPPELGCSVDKCVDACESAALSKGSVGCSFWTLPPDDGYHGAGACFAAMVANTWDRAANITAEWGSESLDISASVYTAKMVGSNPVYTALTGPLPPGEVAIVFLAEAAVVTDPFSVRCPKDVKAAVKIDPIRHGTTKTKAFHLKTDMPVSAYSSFPYGGAESYYPAATLLLPVSSWDTSYIAVSTGKFGDPQLSSTDRRTLQIVANEDDTKVSMRPNVILDEGNDVAGVGANEVQTWTLSRGQVLQITQAGGATGSPIQSNKPVGLFGGAPCNFLPAEVPTCDLTQQQIAPFSQWGTSYALVPFPPRLESVTGKARETVPWMFVGAVDGTTLTYEPSKPPGAPETLSAGQAAYVMMDDLVTVKSQDSKHPFYAGVHMSSASFGGGAPGGGMTKGDPDFVNIVPSDQFLDRYVFFADYTYPETSLTVVRRKSEAGFRPVEIDCGGELGGFQPLGSSGEYEYAWVKLTVAGVPQKIGTGECGYGRHEARSEAPFSITVWGVGQDASYGYAGGMGSRPINDAPPPPVN
jgi:hypothetical protein